MVINISRFKNHLILLSLTIASIISFIAYKKGETIEFTLLLEVIFLMSGFFLIKKIKNKFLFLNSLIISYLTYTFISAVILKSVHPIDYFIAYKFFVYLIFLGFSVKKKFFEYKFTKKLFQVLLFFFFLKYSISILMGLNFRPLLFAENNFELFLILLIYIAVYRYNTPYLNKLHGIILFLIIAMSGSRSALLGLLLMIIILNFSKTNKRFIFKIFIVLISISVIGFILSIRLDDRGLEGVDRFYFLLAFLNDTSQWNVLTWFTGSSPLTPLSPESCKSLSHWQGLFSKSGDGSCYSVILHSFVMRLIYDHGIFGLFFLLLFLYIALKESNYKFNLILIVIGLIMVQSLSVSGMNNPYITLGLLFVLTTYKGDEMVRI
ncbi:hypothetical protein CL647_00800 [bacterium]|nr:hypothetical protein [Actinomycetota bacterium]MBE32665.1 hypothetical protein [bacterium]|tara:strand:+ start:1683 stop:2816 length:1134 start_codon:yes stop_codon:yes gene_type:complete